MLNLSKKNKHGGEPFISEDELRERIEKVKDIDYRHSIGEITTEERFKALGILLGGNWVRCSSRRDSRNQVRMPNQYHYPNFDYISPEPPH